MFHVKNTEFLLTDVQQGSGKLCGRCRNCGGGKGLGAWTGKPSKAEGYSRLDSGFWILPALLGHGSFCLPCPPQKRNVKGFGENGLGLFIVFLAGIKFNVWKGFVEIENPTHSGLQAINWFKVT